MRENIYGGREDIQAAAITAWNTTKIGTLVMPTGLGKTYVGIVVACGLLKKKIISNCLIVVPTTNLIKQWKDEIAKWGYSLDNIDIMCIQTAHKHKATYNLLVIDEVHTATSPIYSRIFTNINYNYVLGLSATVDKEDPILVKYCPVLFESTVSDALASKAFNPYTIYNVEVGMSRKERATYTTFDKQFKIARLQLLLLKKDYPEFKDLTIFDIAKMHSASKEKSELVTYSKMFWGGMSLRKTTCHKAWSKAELAAELVATSPQSKWIIFTMSIDMAEKLAAIIPNSKVYHSKQKSDVRATILEDYRTGKLSCIITVRALDAGLNVPDISHAIAISGDSQELVATQRLGQNRPIPI